MTALRSASSPPIAANRDATVIRLHDHPLSGNGHKVRILLSMLGLPHEHVFRDVPSGRPQQEPEFAVLNPLLQIPILEDGATVIWDSQAILVYLARRYGPDWFPLEPEPAARVMQWLSFATNEINNSLQQARLYFLLGEHIDIDLMTRRGLRVLTILDRELAERPWLAVDKGHDRGSGLLSLCRPVAAGQTAAGRFPPCHFVDGTDRRAPGLHCHARFAGHAA